MMQRASLFQLLTSWILYSLVITLLAAAQALILPVTKEGLTALESFLLIDLGRLMVKFLFLSITGFIVYGFIRSGIGYLKWFNREPRGYVTRIVVFYLSVTLSMLITHLFAYDRLPLGVVVDLPILNAITILIFGSLPYFKRTLFSPQH